MHSNPKECDSREAHRAQGTTGDQRDSHPRRCSFPRGLHLRLCWWYIFRLQFKTRGLDFHAELFPVHSPLLRESCLVSYPPLTYMLKFSGFFGLTSCLGRKGGEPSPFRDEEAHALETATQQQRPRCHIRCASQTQASALRAPRACELQGPWAPQRRTATERGHRLALAVKTEDSEADRPSGMSRRHRMHSRFY